MGVKNIFLFDLLDRYLIMNLKQLESRFKDIEQREKQINSYFNPFNSNGPKHYCIKDLYRDYEYDTQLYGLGKFYQLGNDGMSDKSSLVSPQKKSALESIKVSQKESPGKGKLKEITINDKFQVVHKEEYSGYFSKTRLQPRKTSVSTNPACRSSPEWTANSVNERVSNKSAFEKVRFGLANENNSINLFKKVEKEKVQVHPQDWVVENKYSAKPAKKFSLAEEKTKVSKMKEEYKSKWFEIRYFDEPEWIAQDKGIVTLSLVDIGEIRTVRLKTVANQSFWLGEINWLEKWDKKIVRVQEDFSKYSEYFIYFGNKSEGIEKMIEDEIELYFRVNVPDMRKKSNVSPVMPINLKSGKFASPGRSKSTIKLPVIKEKITSNPSCYDENTLTQRLVKYRESAHNFNPISFPANLTIFEMHDMMESRYRKFSKEKPNVEPEPIGLGIRGKSMKS